MQRGLDRLLGADARDALLVLHKGVIRSVVETLTGEALPPDEPALGEQLVLTRNPDGTWYRGQHSSNPPASPPRDLSQRVRPRLQNGEAARRARPLATEVSSPPLSQLLLAEALGEDAGARRGRGTSRR